MTTVMPETGYEGVPTVRKPAPLRIAGGAVIFVLLSLGALTAIGQGTSRLGPERPGPPSALAYATSCEEVGPISRGGFGYYWMCVAEVDTSVSGKYDELKTVRFGLNELTPADIGKPVKVIKSKGKYQRDVERHVPWWSIAPIVAAVVGAGLWAHRARQRRFRRPARPSGPEAVIAPAVCVRPLGTPGPARSGDHVILPNDWSKAKFWRVTGAVWALAAVSGAASFVLPDGDPQQATRAFAFVGALAPLWVIGVTPRWLGRASQRTELTVSRTNGIGWQRRGKLGFILSWNDIAEVRLVTLTDGDLTLRVVDIYPIDPERRPDLLALWELGAELGRRTLPPVPGAHRIPESLSDMAADKLRVAMTTTFPERFSEYSAQVS
ncbi:DUF6346 domain-containing protein [Amycolatopsis thailandensis]|uniref:DUF6346 domain-containing protein n=1 Tax=Amycolatopsis thailandensis TaxID=589330 RepID=UPI0037A0EA67